MGKIFILLSVVFLCAMFDGCRTRQDHETDGGSWTSMNPLSVPLKVRQDYYRKGNLVQNPSFEDAQVGKNDTAIVDFKLSHWSVVGKDVQLADLKRRDLYDSTDVFQGDRAIKITRTDRDVKEINDPGEGVLSDYIPVIPGNYDFYFDIRLKKIIPTSYLDRLQQRIGKDIDIELKFYDQNKRELDPGIYFQYVHKKVDNSFKGFAFANFFYINKFDWGRVRGETWVYPYSEGDVPDKCRFVRIFFGLKCSGTMWIDNVDFHFSRWNFTPLERMDSMFEKKYDLTDLMIPTPKFITNTQHIDLKNREIALVGEAGSPESRAALSLLTKGFRQANDSVKVYHSQPKLPSSALQVILIDDRAAASSELADAFRSIKGKAQGYFIHKRGDKIYFGANEPRGWFYAASSLCQLIDDNNAVLDYADITDYPDFLGRSTVLMNYQNRWTLEQEHLADSTIRNRMSQRAANLEKQIRDIDFYAFYKINVLYSLYFIQSKRWWLPGSFYTVFWNKIGEKCAAYGNILSTAVQFNPTFHIDMEQQEDTLNDSLRNLFSYGSDASFDKITSVLKPALDAGAKTVMFCSDDYVPHSGIIRGKYTLFTKEDKAEFTNLAAAQDYLIGRLEAWLRHNYGNIRLEFVPPAYNNRFIDYGRGSAEDYFKDLNRHLDSSVVLVWTGNTIRSLSYDMADIGRCTEVYERKPMIWDNSPYARGVEVENGGYPINYPEKSVMCDLFEPFDIRHPADFPAYVDSRYYSNLVGLGEINKIKYMTFADFTWNTKDYNPDFSLFKALVRYVGRKNALLLLKFNDAYYKLVSTWGWVRFHRVNDDEFVVDQHVREQANQEIKAVNDAYRDLQTLDNAGLTEELYHLMDLKIRAWRELVAGSKGK